MNKKLYTSKPPIKVCEWDPTQGGGAYIGFDEEVDIPGLEKARIRIEFERGNSFDEMCELVSILKRKGFKFVVEK